MFNSLIFNSKFPDFQISFLLLFLLFDKVYKCVVKNLKSAWQSPTEVAGICKTTWCSQLEACVLGLCEQLTSCCFLIAVGSVHKRNTHSLGDSKWQRISPRTFLNLVLFPPNGKLLDILMNVIPPNFLTHSSFWMSKIQISYSKDKHSSELINNFRTTF